MAYIVPSIIIGALAIPEGIILIYEITKMINVFKNVFFEQVTVVSSL